jgi:hypothetical protein
MSDRRQFFKQAGAFAAVPLARTPLAQGVTKGKEDPPQRAASEANGIVLENPDFRLVIGDRAGMPRPSSRRSDVYRDPVSPL